MRLAAPAACGCAIPYDIEITGACGKRGVVPFFRMNEPLLMALACSLWLSCHYAALCSASRCLTLLVRFCFLGRAQAAEAAACRDEAVEQAREERLLLNSRQAQLQREVRSSIHSCPRKAAFRQCCNCHNQTCSACRCPTGHTMPATRLLEHADRLYFFPALCLCAGTSRRWRSEGS